MWEEDRRAYRVFKGELLSESSVLGVGDSGDVVGSETRTSGTSTLAFPISYKRI